MPGYSYLTFAQMKQALADRLDDYQKVYWLDAELGLYIQDALRCWQSLTRYWRNTFTFNSSALASPPNAFYDLTQQSNTLIPFTQTDVNLLSMMCYNLIEPQMTGATWNGTDMFSSDDLVYALERRRNQFLLETGMILTRTIVPVPASPIGRVPLSDNVIDVRRAAWIDNLTGATSVVWQSNEYRAQSISYNWFTSPGTPSVYSVAVTPPVTVQLIPPPNAPGRLELLTVNTGAALNPATGVLLGVPDDFTWAVRFGAIADLLAREGQSRDMERSAYCEQRWQEGIAAAKAYTSVEFAFLGGSQVVVGSLYDLDSIETSWQNSTGAPLTFVLASWNLAALSPIPDNNGPYSIQLDVVENAPVPVNAGDFIQLGREELDSVLDYAQHLAAFKQGGAEFKASMKGYSGFIKLALLRNQRLAAALGSDGQPVFDRAGRQERQQKRVQVELPVGISVDIAEGGE
jgi:hypothetical protein